MRDEALGRSGTWGKADRQSGQDMRIVLYFLYNIFLRARATAQPSLPMSRSAFAVDLL